MAAGLIAGVIGVVMALWRYPAYYARCRETGAQPGQIWSTRYLDMIQPDSARMAARRGMILFGVGFTVALLSFPFVLLAGMDN